MYCDVCKSYFKFNDVLFEDGVFKVECKCNCGKKKITSSSNDNSIVILKRDIQKCKLCMYKFDNYCNKLKMVIKSRDDVICNFYEES